MRGHKCNGTDSFRQSILKGQNLTNFTYERRQQQRIEYHNLISAQSIF